MPLARATMIEMHSRRCSSAPFANEATVTFVVRARADFRGNSAASSGANNQQMRTMAGGGLDGWPRSGQRVAGNLRLRNNSSEKMDGFRWRDHGSTGVWLLLRKHGGKMAREAWRRVPWTWNTTCFKQLNKRLREKKKEKKTLKKPSHHIR